MTIERYIRMIAGTVVLTSLALGAPGSPLFVATTLSRNNPRLRQTPAPMPAPVEKAATLAAPVDDFGQKIRDAEKAQLNGTGGSQGTTRS